MLRRILLVLAVVTGLLAASSPAPARASTADPSLAPTPYMGWNTYYGLGGDFTAAEVLSAAQSLKDRGLQAAGYDIVWLDGGWTAPTPRGADGRLQPDPTRFPEGMKPLVDKIHALGFKAGIYTDAGPYDPKYCGLGSYGHQQTDADTFAAWGFDAVKVDFLCGWGAKMKPEPAFRAMAQAIRAADRPMIFNLCNPVTSPYWGDYPEDMQSTGSWAYAPEIAESWRTYTDVGFIGQIQFADVLRNYDANARHPEVAGPGHWNDPDYLGPQLGMTDTEFRTQMSLWTVAAAPLIIASDPAKLSQTSLDILTNPEVLAINQDRLGDQAVRVSAAGTREVWVKKLADGSRAVALLNRGGTTAEISTTPEQIGLNGQRVSVRDVWAHRTSEARRTIAATVPAHGTALLVVKRATGAPGDSRVVVGQPTITQVNGTALPDPGAEVLAAAGSTLTVQVPVRNDGTKPVTDVRVNLTLPDGWTTSGTTTIARLAPGASRTLTLTVQVPSSAKVGSYPGTVAVTVGGEPAGSTGELRVIVAPAQPTGTADLAHHPWVSATSGWMQPTKDRSVGGWSPLIIAGKTYATGIGVASPSDIRWYTGGSCSRLTGIAGIDDAVKFEASGATVTFTIVGDGKQLWTSGVVRRDQPTPFDVDLTGVRDLRLQVGDAGDSGYNDRADWVDLQVRCSG